MRVRPLFLFCAATLFGAAPALSQPKRAAPAVHKKPHGARPAPQPSAAPPSDDNPYGADAPAAAAPSPAPAEAAPAAATEAPAPSSGDAKLDEAPPPRPAEAEGPKPSPLTPEANELGKGAPPPAPVDFERLMADIATLRARVAALTTSLFSSKLRVHVRTKGDDARIQSFAVMLDDGVVFRSDAGFMAEDAKVVYEHAVAPGSHVVAIEIERQDARGPSFRTWQLSRFAIQVPERKVLDADVVVEDDSDMAEDFPDDQDGEYELEVSLRARVAD